jgi:hypothetical protein
VSRGGLSAARVRRTVATPLVAAGVLVTLGAPQPAASYVTGGKQAAAPLFRIDPVAYPNYSPAISDYAVRCNGVTPVRITVNAPAGTRVSVDGRAARGGRFGVDVSIRHGQAFNVTTTTSRARRSHRIRCLPTDFPIWTVDRRPRGSQQWYVVGFTSLFGPAPPYTVVFDRFGTPVWWYRSPIVPVDAKFLGQNIAFSRPEPPHFFNISPTSDYEVRRLDGTLVRTIRGVGGPIDSHELQVHGGNYVYLSYRARSGVDLSPWRGPANATVFDAVIEEATPDGRVVWSWNSKDHVALAESSRWYPQVLATGARLAGGGLGYDILHPNSVDVRGDAVLVSLRHADAVYKIRRSTGRILWKLGGSRTPQSLTVRNDRFAAQPLGGQHDARLLADGSVTIHDNQIIALRRARAVRYRINERQRTATLAEEITAQYAFPSLCCGSAEKLGNGGWLASWGGLPAIEEFDRRRRLVFRLGLGTLNSYRVDGVPAGRVSRAALHAGMDRMNPR